MVGETRPGAIGSGAIGSGAIRPIASLSSGLLARKGHARPAMRPHGFDAPDASADDLGWNDVGVPDPGEARGSDLPRVLVERSALHDEVARLAPSPTPSPFVADTTITTLESRAVDPAIIRRIDLTTVRSGKAAFTLRLPADRHLRLRLAAAVTRRSAQAIVTQALDAFLSTLPDVEDLAGRCSTSDRSGKSA